MSDSFHIGKDLQLHLQILPMLDLVVLPGQYCDYTGKSLD